MRIAIAIKARIIKDQVAGSGALEATDAATLAKVPDTPGVGAVKFVPNPMPVIDNGPLPKLRRFAVIERKLHPTAHPACWLLIPKTVNGLELSRKGPCVNCVVDEPGVVTPAENEN